MKVNGMIEGGIGLAKFTSQESWSGTTLSGVAFPDSQLGQTIRLNYSSSRDS
jgi:hypothetical protein